MAHVEREWLKLLKVEKTRQLISLFWIWQIGDWSNLRYFHTKDE